MKKSIILCLIIITLIVIGGCGGSNVQKESKQNTPVEAASQETKSKHFTYELEVKTATGEEMVLLRETIKNRAEQLGFLNVKLDQVDGQQLRVEFDASNELSGILTKPGIIRFQTEDGKVVITNKHIQEAVGYSDKQSGEGLIQLLFNQEGEKILKDVTTANLNKKLTIYLDDSQLIRTQISKPTSNGILVLGGFKNIDEAREVAFILKNPLPLAVKIVNREVKGGIR